MKTPAIITYAFCVEGEEDRAAMKALLGPHQVSWKEKELGNHADTEVLAEVRTEISSKLAAWTSADTHTWAMKLLMAQNPVLDKAISTLVLVGIRDIQPEMCHTRKPETAS